MPLTNHALVQIAVKTIMHKGDNILVLHTPDNYFDFPGGRLDQSELDRSLEEVLNREIQEELGNGVKFTQTGLAFVDRRKYDFEGQTHHIIAVYYNTTYQSGEIVLSDEHATYEWTQPQTLLPYPERFVSADEFEQFKRYIT